MPRSTIPEIIQHKTGDLIIKTGVFQTDKSNRCSTAISRRFLTLCDEKKGPLWKTCDQYVSLMLLDECLHQNADWIVARRSSAIAKAVRNSKLEKFHEVGDLTMKLECGKGAGDDFKKLLKMKAVFK